MPGVLILIQFRDVNLVGSSSRYDNSNRWIFGQSGDIDKWGLLLYATSITHSSYTCISCADWRMWPIYVRSVSGLHNQNIVLEPAYIDESETRRRFDKWTNVNGQINNTTIVPVVQHTQKNIHIYKLHFVHTPAGKTVHVNLNPVIQG